MTTTSYAIPYQQIENTPWQALPLRSSATSGVTKWAVRLKNGPNDDYLGSFDMYERAMPNADDILRNLRQMAKSTDDHGDPKHAICWLLRADDPITYQTMIAPWKSEPSTAGES
jgi:hypothetical protein